MMTLGFTGAYIKPSRAEQLLQAFNQRSTKAVGILTNILTLTFSFELLFSMLYVGYLSVLL